MLRGGASCEAVRGRLTIEVSCPDLARHTNGRTSPPSPQKRLETCCELRQWGQVHSVQDFFLGSGSDGGRGRGALEPPGPALLSVSGGVLGGGASSEATLIRLLCSKMRGEGGFYDDAIGPEADGKGR